MPTSADQNLHILDTLYAVILSRRGDDAAQSWTATLLADAPDLPVKKMIEEAGEVAIEAIKGDRDALTREAADLLYHLLVVMAASGVSASDVWAELERRQRQSGLAEKAGRKSSSSTS